MKKLMLLKLKVWQALLVIFLAAMAATVPLAVRALGLNFGGRITYIGYCVIEDPVFQPFMCNTCPLCTAMLASGCAAVNEIQFMPSGGFGYFLCVNKGFLYKGGFPRIGAYLLGSGVSAIMPWQVGVGR